MVVQELSKEEVKIVAGGTLHKTEPHHLEAHHAVAHHSTAKPSLIAHHLEVKKPVLHGHSKSGS